MSLKSCVFLCCFLLHCICLAETLFERFDVNSTLLPMIDVSQKQELKKQILLSFKRQNLLFTTNILQKIQIGDEEIIFEKSFFPCTGIAYFRYRLLRISSKGNEILWQMDYRTTSNQKFFGYIHYDQANKCIQFSTIRKDDYVYTPVIYRWDRNGSLDKKIYPASILYNKSYSYLHYMENNGWGYFLLSAKHPFKNEGDFDVFKLNIGDSSAILRQGHGILSLLFPFIPYELLLLNSSSGKEPVDALSSIEKVSINNKLYTNIEVAWTVFFKNVYTNYPQYYELSDSYHFYLSIMAILESEFANSNKIMHPIESINCFKQQISTGKHNLESIAPLVMEYLNNLQNARFQLLFTQNNFFRKYFIFGDNTTQENEAKNFYNQYKWAFRKKLDIQSEYYTFQEVKNFIYIEIRRLKSYGLKELISNPPKVGIIWKKKMIAEPKRGLLDPPSPEEAERLKAEFLAKQPKENIFTDTEQKELFQDPDYDRITDLYERGMAYDWAEKFKKASECFEKSGTLKSKFMLAKYCKNGNADIAQDTEMANALFQAIIDEIKSKGAETSPEEYCLAGRACLEITPANFTEKQKWKKLAQTYFSIAERQDYPLAVYYPQYYLLNTGDFKPQKILELAKSKNCLDAEVMAAGMALFNLSAFRAYGTRQENLDMLKKGIQAHIPLAEYMLGELFNQNDSNPYKPLKYDKEKALFWIKRAAAHGERLAIEYLRLHTVMSQ